MREEHDAAHDRRAGGRHRRRDPDRRRPGERRAAQGSRHRDGVPELRALPAHDGVREHVLRAAAEEGAQGRDQGAGRQRRPHPGHSGAAGAQAEAALRRPAAARGHGAGHRARPQGVPVRRAAVEPRRQAARADAHRDQARAPEGAHHHHLRHPRPGRGDDAGRSGGGDECGADRAGRRAERAVPRAGAPDSWPASSAHRR